MLYREIQYLEFKIASFFASTFIILLVISALRTDIGTDYVNYVRLYNDIIHDSFVNSNVEVGFYLVVTLSNYISKEPQLMFMIMSLITLTALFSTKKMRGFLGVFGVICVMYLPSFSLIRQTAAVAFVLCAILSLIEGNKKQFLLYIGIGSCFHLSALIILPFILLKGLI
ncbi:EpsG family protein [Escherichia coli]|uniref:EpsG family protein n=1 Tax=Escherichia coli TaxID=562 RepID=UPI004068368A